METNTAFTDFKKFAFTGGPCGGKTSAIPYVRERLQSMGYLVITVPEAATLCKSNGIKPGAHLSVLAFQEAIMDTGFKLEEVFATSIESTQNVIRGVVMLCDRGIIDSLAYMDKEEFRKLLRARGETLVSVRDTRYDAVLHLTTTAIGVPECYTLENNPMRTESLEEARIIDRKTLGAWTDHPHIREIGNDTDFETKLKRVFQEVCIVLGEPVPLENERKFLVSFDIEELKKRARPSDIEQTYLLTPDDSHELRVRKRGQDGEFFYTLTEKKDHGPGKRLEIDRIISESDFHCYLRMRDPKKATVKKTRYCFFHNRQYFEIDIYHKKKVLPSKYNAILEIELTEDSQVIEFPEWITETSEVTDRVRFKNSEIAKRIATFY